MKHILISGGTGLIGKTLRDLLKERGYQVSILSRQKPDPGKGMVHWDVDQNIIDTKVFSEIDGIIHLAGEGIADKRWTQKRKEDIISSRVKSTALLESALKQTNHQVKVFISASAIGYYSDRGNKLLTEKDLPANDFLGQACVKWEKAADRISNLGIRTVKLRTGIVLSTKGGALPPMVTQTRLGFASPLGNGTQWMSWIHIHDLCEMYVFALENEIVQGAYNAASPEPVTNKIFSATLAEAMHKPFWAPAVPKFILKLLLGELAILVTGSTKVSAEKITMTGFSFKFKDLKATLKNLLTKKH